MSAFDFLHHQTRLSDNRLLCMVRSMPTKRYHVPDERHSGVYVRDRRYLGTGDTELIAILATIQNGSDSAVSAGFQLQPVTAAGSDDPCLDTSSDALRGTFLAKVNIGWKIACLHLQRYCTIRILEFDMFPHHYLVAAQSRVSRRFDLHFLFGRLVHTCARTGPWSREMAAAGGSEG